MTPPDLIQRLRHAARRPDATADDLRELAAEAADTIETLRGLVGIREMVEQIDTKLGRPRLRVHKDPE